MDGLGGVTWDGSLLMIALLQRLPLNLHLVELGCGGGLCSLSCALRDVRVSLTDREVDLAEQNLSSNRHVLRGDVEVFPLRWGAEGAAEVETLLQRRGFPDVVVACEVACLRQQQPKLAETVLRLSRPHTLVLVSFDEGPPPNKCVAEREWDERMQAAGMRKAVVASGRVQWMVEGPVERAVVQDETRLFAAAEELCLRALCGACSPSLAAPEEPRPDVTAPGRHHAALYFRPAATRTCEDCGRPRLVLGGETDAEMLVHQSCIRLL